MEADEEIFEDDGENEQNFEIDWSSVQLNNFNVFILKN